jgi:hypothetical protein
VDACIDFDLLAAIIEAWRSRKFSGSPNARSIFHTDNARTKLGAATRTKGKVIENGFVSCR